MLRWFLIGVIQHQHPARPSAVCVTDSQAVLYFGVYMTSEKAEHNGITLSFQLARNGVEGPRVCTERTRRSFYTERVASLQLRRTVITTAICVEGGKEKQL